MLPIDDATLQRIRQLLAPDFRSAARRDVTVWKSGAKLSNPVVASGFEFITSTGAFGGYQILFAPAIFANAPRVVTTLGLAGGASFAVLAITLVSNTGFQFSLGQFSPGIIAIPAATTVLVEWIAVGE